MMGSIAILRSQIAVLREVLETDATLTRARKNCLTSLVEHREAEVDALLVAQGETPPILELGEAIDRIKALRDAAKVRQTLVDAISAEKAALEALVIGLMDAAKLPKASGQTATASITPSIVPSVKDWGVFWGYIHKHKAFHLLERRPAGAAYREEIAQQPVDKKTGKPKLVPGVESFERRTLNIRSL